MTVAATAKWTIQWADLTGVTYALNVLHAQIAAGQVVTQDLTNALGAAVATAYTNATSWRGATSNQTQLRAVTLQDIRQDGHPEFAEVLGLAGTSVSDALADPVSLVFTKQTGGGTPNGRIFLWGMSEEMCGPSGRPTGDVLNRGQQFMDLLIGMFPISAGGNQLLDMSIVGKNALGDPTRFTVLSANRSPSANVRGWQTQRGRRTAVREP